MLVGIMGKMGSGKTLSQTILCWILGALTKSPVYANYTLNFPCQKLENLGQLWQADHGIVAFDELWLTMDSRFWANNVMLSRWINQTRKKDLLVFYTTQHIGQVDIRVRRATDWLIFCEKRHQVITITFIDYQYGQIGKRFRIERPQDYYSLYNTYEILKPLTLR